MINVVRDNNAIYSLVSAAKKRLLKSPLGDEYRIPNEGLARLLALELTKQIESINLVNVGVTRALSLENSPKLMEECKKSLHHYYQTDTLLFRPEFDSDYFEKKWDPCLTLFSQLTGLTPNIRKNFSKVKDPQPFVDLNLTAWKMTALELATQNCKSFILGTLFVNDRLTGEEAADLALCESERQAQKWGVLEDTHLLESLRLKLQLALAKLFIFERCD